jgi:hypothetical protein
MEAFRNPAKKKTPRKSGVESQYTGAIREKTSLEGARSRPYLL